MRLVRHVVRMGWMKIAQKLLLGTLQARDHLEDLSVDTVKLTRFVWLLVGFCEHISQSSDSI